MKIDVESNPISYKFTSKITIISTEIMNSEVYLEDLMNYFDRYNFKIINGTWKKVRKTHDRLGRALDPESEYNAIIIELVLERIVDNIHSPSNYIEDELNDELYYIFDQFNTNDSVTDYIEWISNAVTVVEDNEEDEEELPLLTIRDYIFMIIIALLSISMFGIFAFINFYY